MIDNFLKLIESLPKVSANWKALLFLSLTGLFVGFSGIPLWLVYRNEDEVLRYLFSRSAKEVDPYPRQDLLLIRENLQTLIRQTGANRAIFGIVKDYNRLILVESFKPLEEQLPLGYQTVYLNTSDYESIFNTFRLSSCVSLEDVNQGSYFQKELQLSNARFYLACPSKESNWFIALYLSEREDQDLTYLEETVKDVESLLNLQL